MPICSSGTQCSLHSAASLGKHVIGSHANPPSDIKFSKLRFYVVHTLGAKVDKIMHLAVCSCVLPHIKV